MTARLSFKSMDERESTAMNAESSSVQVVGDGSEAPGIVPVSSFHTNTNKKEKREDNSSRRKRSSFSFRLKKKKEKQSVGNVVVQDDNSAAGSDDDDPVMEIFEARSTQRVRFAVEGGDVKPSRRVPKERRDKSPPPQTGPLSPSSSIKRFMKGALFSPGKGSKSSDDFDQTLKQEIDIARQDSDIVWEDDGSKASDIVRSKAKKGSKVKFVENEVVRANVTKLLNKGRRAQTVHMRYEYSVNCYIKALNLLTDANYPEEHPTLKQTVEALNQAHHALNSYRNSANIVKMGIKYEDTGEWVRALKMYTIAYRIRRDNLSRSHPSLMVLLNMLGSIQIKRGELEEAMQIYELALKDHTNEGNATHLNRPNDLLARGVSYREMGTVHERWGETNEALDMYHRSLDCVSLYKAKVGSKTQDADGAIESSTFLSSPEDGKFTKSTVTKENDGDQMGSDTDGMEMMFGNDGFDKKGRKKKNTTKTASTYDKYFPRGLDKSSKTKPKKKDKKKPKSKADYADVDVAVTLHQIGQLHRAKGEFDDALSAYNVSLRGMKHTLGKNHPNTAAILGNIGNLQKEMGDMDAAFETYQQVLSIESYRLGLSHPDVAVTLHNIATIDAARGNNDHALALYKQVISLQRKLFGENNPSVAVTSACMGDVYERLGDIKQATECFEEAVRIKTASLGRHSLEVSRLLHKLGKLSALNGDFHLADSYISRCILVYRLNKLSEEDEWVVDAYRDAADIDAAIAMGRGNTFEC